MRYLSAHYVFPISSPPLKNGIICVGDDGSIIDVIDTGGKLEEREKLEFYNGILVPGFVNVHCHLELSHLRNAMTPHCGLPRFISYIGKLRIASRETILNTAKDADEEMTRNGIVAVGDISNNAETLSVKRNSRIKYHTFIELFGLDGNRSEEIFATAQLTKQEYEKVGMTATMSPHAVYSVSQELWKLLIQSYTTSPPHVISMHHQESSEEMNDFFDGKGELSNMLKENGLNIPAKDTLSQVMRCFQEATRCLLVHNIFSNSEDLLKYKSVPERFYFVLCPVSNMFIQNTLPNLQLFLLPYLSQHTCLGTDSLASNTSLSILNEMKIIQNHLPEISLETLLQWATINGAKALGFDDFCGSIERNKTPGINLITGIDFDNMRLTANSAVIPLSG